MLRVRDGALILVSSKTLAEMEGLHRELNLTDPFIVENGGGIAAVPESWQEALIADLLPHVQPLRRDDFVLFPLGKSYGDLVASLRELAAETGFNLRGFSAMSEHEVVSLTGLSTEAARLALTRDFDEPFLAVNIEFAMVERLCRAASARGLTVAQGGRFWHLIGHGGKGQAVALVREAYRMRFHEVNAIGLGDSPNDYSFLELMDLPVLVGVTTGHDPVPGTLLRALQVTAAGPEGWNEAILGILARRT